MENKNKIEALKTKIKEDFFKRKKATRATWEEVCRKSIMPEFILEEFVEELSWEEVCTHQVLSENFIRKFKKSVKWTLITKVQLISEDFIQEMEKYIDWEALLYSRDLSEEFLRRNSDKFKIWLDNWHKKEEVAGALSRHKAWFTSSVESASQKQTLLRNLIKLEHAIIWDDHYDAIKEETLNKHIV